MNINYWNHIESMEPNKYSQKTSCHFLTSLTLGQLMWLFAACRGSMKQLLCKEAVAKKTDHCFGPCSLFNLSYEGARPTVGLAEGDLESISFAG